MFYGFSVADHESDISFSIGGKCKWANQHQDILTFAMKMSTLFFLPETQTKHFLHHVTRDVIGIDLQKMKQNFFT